MELVAGGTKKGKHVAYTHLEVRDRLEAALFLLEKHALSLSTNLRVENLCIHVHA